MEHVKQLIRARRSVRTFDGRAPRAEDMAKIEKFLEEVDNPFGADIDFRILSAARSNLSSAVIVGTDTYVAAKVKRVKHYEMACGYAFEKFCLFAWSLGLGTVMLAGTLSRQSFEKAMEVGADEVMPVASPLGYAAEKQSIREKMMRKTLKADERMPFEQFFFESDFAHPAKDYSGIFQEALELARLAPSAANKQPLRAVIAGDTVHFYECKGKMANSSLGDVQKLDIGIALSHFALCLQEDGISGRFYEDKPDIACEENVEYMISFEVNR